MKAYTLIPVCTIHLMSSLFVSTKRLVAWPTAMHTFCVKMWFVVTLLFWTSRVILLVATHSFLSHMVSVFVSCKAYSCHCCWLRPVLAQGLYCTPVHEGFTGDDARMHWASRLKLVHAHISYHARYL